MEVRPWAEFTSTLPSDRVEDEDDIIRQGGRNVAEAIGELLRKLGCEVEAPADAGDHGWDFEARLRRRSITLQVTEVDGYWLLVRETPVLFSFRRKPAPEYLEILRHLAREMAGDNRFVDIRWKMEPGGDDAGYAEPIG